DSIDARQQCGCLVRRSIVDKDNLQRQFGIILQFAVQLPQAPQSKMSLIPKYNQDADVRCAGLPKNQSLAGRQEAEQIVRGILGEPSLWIESFIAARRRI